MEEKLLRYVAEKAINDFRNNALEPEVCKTLSRGEYSKSFRELISANDRIWLFDKLKDDNDDIRIFAGVIIRPIINLCDVEDLFNYWNNSTNPLERDYFVYDLADYKNLTENQHRKLFDYIKENLDFFITSKRDYLKAEIAVEDLKKKMKGTKIHPLSKKWIYWINILSYLDVLSGQELMVFLNDIDTSATETVSEDFYIEVKDFLYNKLFNI